MTVMTAYRVHIDGKPVTMLDPNHLSFLEVAQFVIVKFGAERIGAIEPLCQEKACGPGSVSRAVPAAG